MLSFQTNGYLHQCCIMMKLSSKEASNGLDDNYDNNYYVLSTCTIVHVVQ